MPKKRNLKQEDVEVILGVYINSRAKIKDLTATKNSAATALKEIVQEKGTEYPSKGSKPNKTMKVKVGATTHAVSAIYASSQKFSDNAIELLKKRLPKRYKSKVITRTVYEEIDEELLESLISEGKLEDDILDDVVVESAGRYSIDVK